MWVFDQYIKVGLNENEKMKRSYILLDTVIAFWPFFTVLFTILSEDMITESDLCSNLI